MWQKDICYFHTCIYGDLLPSIERDENIVSKRKIKSQMHQNACISEKGLIIFQDVTVLPFDVFNTDASTS